MRHTGYVYEKGTEKPLTGVVASDGWNVVKTDSNGFFQLNGWSLAHFIMITLPSGYKGGYYIPIKEGNASYDFYLEKIDPAEEHSFLQVSDTEIGAGGAGPWLEHVKRIVKEEKPAFLIHTGDICYPDGLKRHIKDMNEETMGCPVKYVIGNHDYVDGEYGEALFEQIYGPTWYSFDVGSIHYAVTPIGIGDYKSAYHIADSLQWLKNDLSMIGKDKKVIIFNHAYCTDENGYVMELTKEKLDLKEYGLLAWIFGHEHQNFLNDNNGIYNISTARPDCGGIDQAASGTRVVRIDKNNQLTTEMRYFDFDQPVAAPDAKWITWLGGRGLYSDPILLNGDILVGTCDDDFPKRSAVYRVDGETGDVRWSCPTKNSVKNQIAIYNNNKVLAQDCEGNVYCLNAEDGRPIWTKTLALGSPNDSDSNVLADGNTLYAGTGGYVYALDMENGNQKWAYAPLTGYTIPARMRVCKDTLIVSSNWDMLYGLDKNTGKRIWKIKDHPKLRFRSSTPLCVGENFYIAAVDGLFLINGKTGKILYETAYPGYNFNVTAEPVLVKGENYDILYINTGNKGIIAVRLDTYEMIWNFETGESMVYTSPYSGIGSKTVEGTPFVEKDRIYFGASDGCLYCLNRQTGALISKLQVGAPIFTAVTKNNGNIAAMDFGGRLASYNI